MPNNVTGLRDSLGSCIDKWYLGAICPSSVEAKIFCNFRYFVRDRVALTVTPKYANIMVWARWGPNKTFYQLTQDGVYGSTSYDSFPNTHIAV